MTVFFTSDSHFGHARIVELCNRPFKATKQQTAVEVMNDALVARWNAVVSEGDTVYHMGDVALGPIAESLIHISRLNGHKILVEGNHDRPFMARQDGKAEKMERERQRYLDAGFAEVHENLRLSGFAGMEPVALSHFPYTGDHFDGDRYESARQDDNGLPIVHGHTHSDRAISYSKSGTLQIHVGVDTWNFAPVSYERVTEIIRAVTP